MTKPIPTIQKFMTTSPHSVASDLSLAKAAEMMRSLKIRHLPVLDAGELTGIISDRDIKVMEGFKDIDMHQQTVGGCAVEQVFTVAPDALLDEVCDQMAENKFGCAVVMDNNKLVGIFTWVDALRAMSDLLRTRLAK